MDDFTLLRVRLTPRGGRDALMKREGDLLYARVAAAPVQGAANKALIELLSDTLGLPKSRLHLQSGETSRDKVVRIEGWDPETLDARLAAVLR
jgi:uncharacterized protein YggU (UPF0235/DUF167 family)